MTLNNEKGFALLAAVIASLIILAVGLLALNLSLGDLSSTRVSIGDKKAKSAMESGIHTLVREFDPDPVTWSSADYTQNCTAIFPSYVWRTIASGIDPHTDFAVCRPNRIDVAPIPFPGYDLDQWSVFRYNATVIGRNTTYKALTRASIGIGYGPVPTK